MSTEISVSPDMPGARRRLEQFEGLVAELRAGNAAQEARKAAQKTARDLELATWANKRWKKHLEQMEERSAATAELRIGDQIFVRAPIMAKNVGMRTERLYDWLRYGPRNGLMLRAMQEIGSRRFYIDQVEQPRLADYMLQLKKPRNAKPVAPA